MQKKKANISILVIFVLIASSLIWVLAMNFVKQLLFASDNILSYYKSYYLANAGLELMMSQVQNRWIGWEKYIWTGNDILRQNFDCKNCDFMTVISGTSKTISRDFWKWWEWCSSPIVLTNSQSLLLPLFQDDFDGSLYYGFITGQNIKNLSDNKMDIEVISWNNLEITIWILVVNWSWELWENGLFMSTGKLNQNLINKFLISFESYGKDINMPSSASRLSDSYKEQDYPFRNYLIISNTNNQEISFCVNASTPLPVDNFYIKSIWRYNNNSLGLELIYKQPIPDYLLNSIIDESE